MRPSVSVIGQGFVGGSMTTVLAERGVKSFVFDISGKVAAGGDATNSFSITEHVRLCDELGVDTHFVCLPTPMMQDGSADTSIVCAALAEIAAVPLTRDRMRIAVVKSTVPPGSCETWDREHSPNGTHVVFSPEFLTEARCIAILAEAYRVSLAPHNPQGPVSTAASLELGFATPSYIICETVHADVP